MLGTRPSDLFPYIDVPRFAELLVDNAETIPEGATAIDANTRAQTLVRAAEGVVCEAVTEGNRYTLQQLRDLVYNVQSGGVNGVIQGDSLIALISDTLWCRAFGRKRYSADSPQGKDPACVESQKYLDRLRKGERIFVLDGVAIRNENGTLTGDFYGSEIPVAGHLEGERLHSNIDTAHRFWGNANRTRLPFPFGYGQDEDGVRVG